MNLTGTTPLTASGPGTPQMVIELTFVGTPIRFNTYTWTVITSANTITGITPANFTVVATNFSLPDPSFWSVLVNPNSVQVQFLTPTPEPGTVLAIGAAGLGVVGWARRRRSANLAA